MGKRCCFQAAKRSSIVCIKNVGEKVAWVIVVIFLFMALGNYFPSSNSSYTIVPDVNEHLRWLEKQSSYKLFLEEQDGSVNLVFHFSPSSNMNKLLRGSKTISLNVTPASETSNAPYNVTQGKYVQSEIRNVTKASSNSSPGTKQTPQPFPLTTLDDPYSINSPKICKGVNNLAFLVVVHTSTVNFENRHSIRETWANKNLLRNYSMRIVFLLGKPEKDSTQILIEHEQLVHRDLVQGRFADSYHNLTHKGVLGLRWISEFCHQAKIVVKVDDDVFLNVFQMLDEVRERYSKLNRSIVCSVRKKWTSPIMRGKSKWKVDESDFFNMTHYPVSYCNGFFVIVTGDIIAQMYAAAKKTSFFWVDDVYLFGLLPDKVGNVTHVHYQNLNLNEKKSVECFTSSNKTCQLLVGYAKHEGLMEKLWYGVLKQQKKLATKYAKSDLFKT